MMREINSVFAKLIACFDFAHNEIHRDSAVSFFERNVSGGAKCDKTAKRFLLLFLLTLASASSSLFQKEKETPEDDYFKK